MKASTHLALWLALLALVVALLPVHTGAAVQRVEVESREAVLGGMPFGLAGAYEKLSGKITFVFDPANPANARIVDLDKAPRNDAGKVEAWANFMVVRPRDPDKGRGVALLEVSNRGGKALLSYFNHARGSLDPTAPQHFGDGLLMRRGLTIIWVGWQFDVPLRDGLLRLHVPVATNEGTPIEGLVRSDWTVDQTVTTLEVGHRGHIAYPVLDPRHPDNVLTVRDGRLALRRIVPRSQWRFAREVDGKLVEDRERIHMPAGFQAGKIYELVYRARNPAVVGLGLAAVRDVMSYAKYDAQSLFPVKAGIAIGISQTGRFLRHFVYQGFNTDENGRKAFDGMLIHTAGAGRGSFNHRFAQPSRDAHRYSSFFYPTDLFPFSGRAQRDPETGKSDGLFAHQHSPDHLPKIFYTNTGYEYWARAASLIHTTVDGRADMELMPDERLYHLAGGQHFVGGFPPSPHARLEGSRAYRGNPLDFLVSLRALLARLLEWVIDRTEPPLSAYPRIDAGTLVSIDRVKFPKIPGVKLPRVVHEAYRVDYGAHWEKGVVTVEPPTLGKAFPSLVSQVDEAGNEVAGLRSVELLAPLATYAPWNLRTGFPGGTHELVDFLGTYIPFPRTEAGRDRSGDPRPSVEKLYPTKAHYLGIASKAAISLAGAGYLLREDIPRVLDRAERHWDWIMGR